MYRNRSLIDMKYMVHVITVTYFLILKCTTKINLKKGSINFEKNKTQNHFRIETMTWTYSCTNNDKNPILSFFKLIFSKFLYAHIFFSKSSIYILYIYTCPLGPCLRTSLSGTIRRHVLKAGPY